MMRRDLRPYAPLGLALAAGGVLGALGIWAWQGSFSTYVQAGLAIGVLGLALWVMLDPGRVQQWLLGRQARYGGNAALMTLAFVGILVIVNYLAQGHSKRWDLTEDKTYTLAEQSREVVANLPQPVEAVAFYTSSASGARESIEPLLKEYQLAGDGKFSYRFVDPVSHPAEATSAGVTRDGTIVFTLGERTQSVNYPQEEDITGALVKLSSSKEPAAYFLSGHGERAIDEAGELGLSHVKQALERQNFKVESLSLLNEAGVPEGADVVIVDSPATPLAQPEVDALTTYLSTGGSLVWLQEPSILDEQAPAADPLADYVSTTWGLSFRNDVVIDLQGSQDLFTPAVAPPRYGTYGPSPITAKLSGLALVFPAGLRSVAVSEAPPAGVSETKLVDTGDQVWGETDFEGIRQYLQDGGNPADHFGYDEGADLPGPLTVAASAADSNSAGRVVLIGDSDFIAQRNFEAYGNGDFFLGSVNWAAEQEALISLTPKSQTNRVIVPPTAQTSRLIFLGTVVLLPLAVLLAGAAVWWQRRQHM